MALRKRTLTLLRMGRSKAQLIDHLDRDHATTGTEGLTYDQVRAAHRQAHRAFDQFPDQESHRHVGSEWCRACWGKVRSDFHSCQFYGTGNFTVAEGSKNVKLCRACVDDSALRHSCGLARLQRMLSW